MNPNRYIKRAKMAREVEMLILREMLIGEDQHRVFRKGIVDSDVIGGLDLLRQIDVSDLSGKTWRDRNDRDGHVFPSAQPLSLALPIGSLRSNVCNARTPRNDQAGLCAQ